VGEELELIGLYKAGDSSSRVPAAVRQYYSHTLTAIGLERESYILGKNLSDEEISNFNADDGPGWALSHGQDAAAQHQLPKWARSERMPIYLLVVREGLARARLADTVESLSHPVTLNKSWPARLDDIVEFPVDTFWDRILQKLSLSLNTSTSRIAIYWQGADK